MPYFHVRLSHPCAEQLSPLLFDYHASGIEVINDATVEAYFPHSRYDSIDQLQDNLSLTPYTIKSIELREDYNWTAKCTELMQPLRVGSLVVQPIESYEPLPSSDSETLYIIPGSGFGTGHHATTSMILEALQSDVVRDRKPTTFIDVGTGSGILAIAVRKLFSMSVEGVDTDLDALTNAKENIAINHLSEEIPLTHGSIVKSGEKFDCILANLYLQVLLDLESIFHARLNSEKGLLIISGIQKEQYPEFRSQYGENWQILETMYRGDWVCVVLGKLTCIPPHHRFTLTI